MGRSEKKFWQMEHLFEAWDGREAWLKRGALSIEKMMYSRMNRRPASPPDLHQRSPPPFSEPPFPSSVHLSQKSVTEPAVFSTKGCEAQYTQDKKSPDLTLSPHLGSSPSPLSWSCQLAWKLENLKENSPYDTKLQKLKERIRQQKKRCLSEPLKEKRLAVCSREESLFKQPLKRKVRKVAFVSPAPVDKDQSDSGRRASKKKRSCSNTSPPLEKAQKGKAVQLSGVSAWREGQKLARKILGPPLKHPKLRSGSEWDAAKPETESGDLLTTSQVKQSPGESFQAMQSGMGKDEEEREAVGLNQMLQEHESSHGIKNQRVRLQKDPVLEKEKGKQPRWRGSKENTSPKWCSTKDSSFDRLEDHGRSSTDCKGRMSRSSQRSDSSRKEKIATESCKRPEGWRSSSYSPEEVREFMHRKIAERNRRSREEKRSLEQAREARKERLQEVYRKQKEAFRRGKNGVEAQKFGAASALYAKDIHGLKHASDKHPESEVMERVHQVSRALLRDEGKLHRDLHAKMDKMEDMKVDSLENGSAFTSPLKRKDLDDHSFLTSRYSGSPFLSKRLGLGFEAPAVLEASDLSPYRNKGDRVRAIHMLARDLSQRLEREMEKLQIRNRPVDLKDQRWSSETPAHSDIPQKAFGLTVNPNAPWDPSHSLDLPAQAQKSREGIFLEGDSHLQVAKERLQPFLTPSTNYDALRWASSLEERQSTVDIEGCAVKEGSQKERNILSKEPGAKFSMPSFPLCSGRIPLGSLTSSLDDIQMAPHQNMEVEKDIAKKHPGLQLGRCINTLRQGQAHSKTSTADEETGDKSEPVDSTSQWSEMSQFYGSSSTFHRFGLTMVEQHLREEELRARHQSALLRLREKALHEKARAELAWLEHEKSCQGSLQDSDTASATAEKQSALLTRLKQEQAEIRHLQNICRSAHQERKLLLKQQKDLLLVQQTTAQLWKQLHEQLEKSLQQVHGTQKKNMKPPLHVSSVATDFENSRDRSCSSPQQGVDTNNLCTESGGKLSQGVEESEEFPKEKQQPRDQEAENKDTITAKDFHFSKEQPIISTIIRGCRGTGDNFMNQKKEEQDTKEDPLDSSMNEEPQGLASTISPAKLYSFSPSVENPQSDAEFHKAHAILINISGSSLSSFEEAEDAQDTDISLPEEFIFQEELHDDRYGEVFHDTLAVPQIAIDTSLSSGKRGHTQMSGDHSDRDDLPATCSQGKTLEGMSTSERADGPDSLILSSDGSPRPNSLSKGGSYSGQTNTMTFGRDPVSLKDSDPRAESVDNMAFQEDAEPAAVVSCSRTCFDSPKDQKKQGPTEASSIVEGDCNNENPSSSSAKNETMTLVPKSCLKDVDSLNDDSEILTSVETQLFPSQNSSNPLLVLDSRSGCVEHSVGKGQSSILDEVPTTQLPKVSMSDDEIGVGSLCPPNTEGAANGNQHGSTMNSQNTKESGMATLHSSSPKAGEVFSPKNQDDAAIPSNEHLPGVEDEILSPVDEVLSYESSDLPSSTKKDISFQSEDLPAPPEDLSDKGGASNFSLQDFPSPPEQFVFPETGELQYATEEDISIKTNDLPSLSDDLRSE